MSERRVSTRILSALLVLCMVIGMCPAIAMPARAAVDDTTKSAVQDAIDDVKSYVTNNVLTSTNYDYASTHHTDGEKEDDKEKCFSWDTEGKVDDWRYYNGLMVDAMLMLGAKNGDLTALNFASRFYNANVTSGGKIARYNSDTIDNNELDSIQPARALFDLLGTVEDQTKYAAVLHSMYHQMATVYTKYDGQSGRADAGNNFLHKVADSWRYWNIGLDGLYMGLPFLMEYANAIDQGLLANKYTVSNKEYTVNTAQIYTDVYERFMWVSEHMTCEDTDGNVLYLHGYSIEDETPNDIVWARGAGWYVAALVDVIELMPTGKYKTDLIAVLEEFFDGMLAYQTDGMWYNVVYDASTGKEGAEIEPVDQSNITKQENTLEVSGTSLVAYALLKAANNNWITAKTETYGDAGLKAIIAMHNKGFVSSSQVTHIYASAGVGDHQNWAYENGTKKTSSNDNVTGEYFDKNEWKKNSNWIEGEAKGVGPLMMAIAQADKFIGNAETFTAKVEAPTIQVAVGSQPDYSAVAATIVGNQGTILNLSGSQLQYGEPVAAADLDTSTAQTVQVPVLYNSTQIGTVNVEIVDAATATGTLAVEGGTVTVPDAPAVEPDDTWKTLATAGTVYQLYTGDYSGLADKTFLIVDESSAVALRNPNKNAAGEKENVTFSADKQTVTISETNAPYCEWKFEANTASINSDVVHSYAAYTVSNAVANQTVRYIHAGSNFINSSSSAIYVADYGTGNELILSTNLDDSDDGDKVRPIYYAGTAWARSTETKWNDSNDATANWQVLLYQKTGGDANLYGKLNGTTGYVYAAGTAADTILSEVAGDDNFTVSRATQSDYSDAATLALNGEGVTLSWASAPEENAAGDYEIAVKLNGYTVGTIPVTIYDTTSSIENHTVKVEVTPGIITAKVGDNNTVLSYKVYVDGTQVSAAEVSFSGGSDTVATVSGNNVAIKGKGTTSVTATLVELQYNNEKYTAEDFGDIVAAIPVTVTEAQTHTHSYTSELTTAPTCTTDGVMTYTCSGCNDTKTETVAALGHDYVDGDCSRCDAVDPDYSGSEEPTEPSTGSYTYVLDTDGIDSGDTYVIVVIPDPSDATAGVALMRQTANVGEKTKALAQAVKVSADKNTITIADNAAYCEWVFAAHNSYFYVNNAEAYIVHSGSTIVGNAAANIRTAPVKNSAGEYVLASEDITVDSDGYVSSATGRYAYSTETGWTGGNNSGTVLLYKLDNSSTPDPEPTYTASITPSSTSMSVNDSQTLTAALTMDGEPVTENVTYTWSVVSGNATIENGVLHAGRTAGSVVVKVVASVSGTEVDTETTTITVTPWEDNWTTKTTKTVDAEAGDKVIFTISGDVAANEWGWMDNLVIYKDGAAVSTVNMDNYSTDNWNLNNFSMSNEPSDWKNNNTPSMTLYCASTDSNGSAVYTYTVTEPGTYHFGYDIIGSDAVVNLPSTATVEKGTSTDTPSTNEYVIATEMVDGKQYFLNNGDSRDRVAWWNGSEWMTCTIDKSTIDTVIGKTQKPTVSNGSITLLTWESVTETTGYFYIEGTDGKKLYITDVAKESDMAMTESGTLFTVTITSENGSVTSTAITFTGDNSETHYLKIESNGISGKDDSAKTNLYTPTTTSGGEGEGGEGGDSGNTGTGSTSYELYTGDGSDIKNGDVFLIVSSDQKWALMNEDDGEESQIAGLSTAATIDGTKAIISTTDEPYAIWTVSEWAKASNSNINYYKLKFSNNGRFVGDSDGKILKSSGKTLCLLKTDTNGKYTLTASVSSSDGALVPSGNHWYYDGTNWVRASASDANTEVRYVYLYKQTIIVEITADSTRLVIGAEGNNNQMPSTQLAATVYKDGKTDTNAALEWSVAEGSEGIVTVSDTGLVTAVKGGTATVHVKATLSDGSGTFYEDDIQIVVGEPTIIVTEEMDLIAGSGNDKTDTVDTTVYAGGEKVGEENFTLTYSSSNPDVATVNPETGDVTAVAKGTATITTTLTEVNGLNLTGKEFTVTGTTTVNVTEPEISNAHLNSYDYIVGDGWSDKLVQDALQHMVLSISWNTGDSLTSQYKDGTTPDDKGGVLKIELPNDFSTDLPERSDTVIHKAVVTYTDSEGKLLFEDTIWIHVEPYDPNDYSGTVMEEYGISYVLDTDGNIDVNEEYIIVAKDNPIALMNPSATTTACTGATTTAVTFIENKNQIELDAEDAKLSSWLIDTPVDVDNYTRYNVSNFLRYLGTDTQRMLIHENVEHVYIQHVQAGEYRIILSLGSNGQPTSYLNYNGRSWEVTSNQSSVYLYRKYVSYTDHGVDFSVDPTEINMPEGYTTTITPDVFFNNTTHLTSDRYEIIWSSSDTSVATVDQNGKVTAISASDTPVTITAKLVSVDGFEVVCNTHDLPYIEKTTTVKVASERVEPDLTPDALVIGVGSMPNLEKVNVTMTYPDLSPEDQQTYNYIVDHELLTFKMADAVGTVTLEDGTVKTVTGFTSKYPGEFTVDVTYAGQTFPLTIRIDSDPYAGRAIADSIPGYPDPGAVRISKSATGVIDFTRTGVAKLELNAAGISTESAVDVVLIVDVSNSMGWTMEWFGGDVTMQSTSDWDKIPAVNTDFTPVTGSKTKLDMAMESASSFAEILLTEGSGNTLSFVTFAGDNGADSNTIDSVRTPFVGVESYQTANAVFADTKFTHFVTYEYKDDGNTKKKLFYYLDIGGVGTVEDDPKGDPALKNVYSSDHFNDKDEYINYNRGNTNYDYAFGEAADAVARLKAQYAANNPGTTYDESGRKLYVVFMTDGAPSHYNNQRANGSSNDIIWNGSTPYPAAGNYLEVDGYNYTSKKDGELANDATNWLVYMKNNHDLATELYEEIYGLYSVGFDLAHGGFNNFSWGSEEMNRVLSGMVENTVVPVTLATQETELKNFYTNLAKALAYAGTSGEVTDQIGDNFSLFTGMHMYSPDVVTNSMETDENKEMTSEVFNQMSAMDFDIEILSYRLVLASDIGKHMHVVDINGEDYEGEIKDEHLGLRVVEDPEVIETIHFEHDATTGKLTATSTALTADNILSTNVTRKSLVPTTDLDEMTGTYSAVEYVEETYDMVIEAKYFTYTQKTVTYTDDEGKTQTKTVENIEWKIGDITDREISMSYYAYLEGSLDNPKVAEDGMYETNEFAYLQYIDVNGNYAKVDYGVPTAAWGKAGITYRFYLVNECGEFVNRSNVTFTNPANRIILNERVTYTTELNNAGTPLVIDAAKALADAGLGKYVLLDPSLHTEVTTAASNPPGSVVLSGSFDYGDKVPGTEGKTYVADSEDLVFVNDVMNDKTYVNTIIDIPVVLKDLGSSDRPMAVKNVVMDYGKEFPIDPFVKDEADYATGYYNTRDGVPYWYTMEIIGFADYDPDQDLTAYIDASKVKTSVTTENGTYTLGEVDNNGRVQDIVFTPSCFLEKVDKVFVAIKFAEYTEENGESTNNDMIMYKLVTVSPATIMYYEVENNLAGEFAFVGTHGLVDENGNPELDQFGNPRTENDWTHLCVTETITNEDDSTETVKVIGRQDEHVTGGVYGADSNYDEFDTFSDNGYAKADGQGVLKTKVSFSFNGTGFDIISKTGAEDGTIRVTVTGTDDNSSFVKTVTVSNKGENELFQIPVVSIHDLKFGTYKVEIGVFEALDYTGKPWESLSRGDNFYFDAIRIYDPVEADTTLVSNFKDRYGNITTTYVKDQYIDDSEYDPELYEVRDLLIARGDADISSDKNGISFLDKSGEDLTIQNYEAIGPNNEVYIASNNAIAFAITWEGTAPTSIDVGAKSIEADKPAMLRTFISASEFDDTFDPVDIDSTTPINSATAQFYELVNSSNADDFANTKTAYVYIDNYFGENADGTTEPGVLSITDIKVAFDDVLPDTASTYSRVRFFVDQSVIDFANTCANFGDTDEDPSTEPTNAVIAQKGRTLQYKDKIHVVDIFELNGVEGVNLTKDAGLLVWSVDEYEALALNGQITYDAAHAIAGLRPFDDTGYYYGIGNGIIARDLHEEAYYAGYVKLADGTYILSDAIRYSPATYAYNMLGKGSTSAKTRDLCVALLNYISAAQKYFDKTADEYLVNADLSDEQKALNWNPDELDLNLAPEDPTDKNMPVSDVFTKVGKTLLFEEMISLVALYEIEDSVIENAAASGTIFWTAEQFAALEGMPSVDNFGKGTKSPLSRYNEDNTWYSAAPAVAPKDMADTAYYILGYVIHADGSVSYSGVMAYSFEEYINNKANSAAMGEFAMRLYYYERAAKAALGTN